MVLTNDRASGARGRRLGVLAGLVAVIALVVWWLPVASTTTTSATGNDLLDGLRILRGEMIERVWRPVVYLAVATFIGMFGPTVEAVLYATRVFWAASIVVLYLAGVRLFSVPAGLAAVVLATTSFAVNHSASAASPVDTLTPLLGLLVVWLTYEALRRPLTGVAALCGATIAVACLTKEVMLPFVALPALAAWLAREDRFGPRRRALAVIYAAFAAGYFPWVVYAGVTTGKLSWFLGDAAPWAQEKFLGYATEDPDARNPILNALTLDLHNSAVGYYRVYLARFFPVAPLLVLTVAATAAWAARARTLNVVVIAGGLLLYSPSVLVQAAVGERLAHGLTFFLLLYLALAGLLVYLPAAQFGRTRLWSSVAAAAGVGAVAWIGWVQWTAAPNPTRELLFPPVNEQPVGSLDLWRGRPLQIAGRFDRSVEEAAAWVMARTPGEDVILVDGGSWNAVQVMTRFERKLFPLPTIHSTDDIRKRLSAPSPRPFGRPLLAAPSPKFFEGDVRRYRVIFVVFENDILEAVQTSGAKYLLLGPQRYYVSLYLDAVPWATKLFTNGETAVYGLDQSQVRPAASWRFVSGNATPGILTRFAEAHSSEYQDTIEVLAAVGVSEQQLRENTYEARQREWLQENLAADKRIMYSSPEGHFAIPGWEHRMSWFNQDRPLESLDHFDYLALHSLRRVSNEYPRLFSDLEKMAPMKIFPNLPELDFGTGWEIYDLRPAARGERRPTRN